MSRLERQKVCIVGGGTWLRPLCEALMAQGMPPLSLHLVANRFDRLTHITSDLRDFIQSIGGDMPVVPCRDLREAAEGAAAVVLLFRVGGLAARAQDEALAEAFGHVGDEGLALGGAANAWRTAPVLSELARTLSAMPIPPPVLNMLAPLGLSTRLLIDEGLPALGLCELPTVTAERLQLADLCLQGSVAYAGLNHLGWFWPTDQAGTAALERAVGRAQIDAQTLAAYGAAPLHYYDEVVDREAGLRLGKQRSAGRAASLARASELAFAHMSARPGEPLPAQTARQTPWFDRALAPTLAALLGGPEARTPVNLSNAAPAGWCMLTPAEAAVSVHGKHGAPPRDCGVPRHTSVVAVRRLSPGLAAVDPAVASAHSSLPGERLAVHRGAQARVLSGLPDATTVEVFAQVRQGHIALELPPAPPAPVAAFLLGLATYEQALIDAVRSREMQALAHALTLGPWALSPDAAQRAAECIAQPSS